MTTDNLGNLWMGHNGGVSKIRGNYLTNFTNELMTEETMLGPIEKDRSGEIWFGISNGIGRYDGKKFYTYNCDLVKEGLRTIYNDTSGNVWLSGAQFGVIKFDGKSYTVFSNAQGLSSVNNNHTCLLYTS